MKLCVLTAVALVLNASAGDWLCEREKWAEAASCDQLLSLTFGAPYRGERSLVVSNCANRTADTAWRILSVRQPVPQGKRFLRVAFRAAADWVIRESYTTEGWCNAVDWYDAEGRRLRRTVRNAMTISRRFSRIAYVDEVPPKATGFAVEFGFDTPDVPLGKSLALTGLDVQFSDSRPADEPVEELDLCEPEVRFTPPQDARDGFSLAVTDDRSGVDWTGLAVAVDGVDVTKGLVRRENGLMMSGPGQNWTEGLHKVAVDVSDGADNRAHSVKYFHIGPRQATSPVCRLRRDGMMTLDGLPFFPVGIYGVCRREFNAYDFDRACADLKAGGFNVVQSYSDNANPAFLAAARRHGLRTWCEFRTPEDGPFRAHLQGDSSCIARYTGDDTSMHFSPSEMLDRHENVKAVDPGRLTCQADLILDSKNKRSRYRDYVGCTDVFMPEIYPVRTDHPDWESNCVAVVIRDMNLAWQDIAESGDVAPHAVWPIIQYFKGWSFWKRFPTWDELYAMSFAAIVHGANGIVLYTYGGCVVPEQKTFNYGVTTSCERWLNTTNLSTRIASLAPALMSETGGRCDPEVIAGPRKDGLGHPSVTAIWRQVGGQTFVIAVNGSRERVSAAFRLPDLPDAVEVLWENRRIGISSDGFADEFAPYGVHVYCSCMKGSE